MRREELTREILRLALPAGLQNLLHVVVLLADTKMVAWYAGGHAGPLAALALTGPLLWSLTVIFSITSIGTTAVVARRVGEGDLEQAGRATSTAVTLAAVAGGVVVVGGLVFCESVVTFLGSFGDAPPSAEFHAAATGYLWWVLLLFPFKAIAVTLEASLRGAGDAKTPLWAGFLANYVNVFANAVFIFGLFGAPEMGVAGAGLGTALAAVAECAFLALMLGSGWLRRLHVPWRRFFLVDRRWLRTIVRVSLPALLDSLVFHSGFMVYQLAIYELTEAAIAAHRITITLESAAFMPAVGFAVSASSLSGRLLGAGQPELATIAARRNAWIGVLLLLPVSIGALVAAGPLARFFSDSAEVWPLAADCLRVGALEIPFLVAATALTGTLRGAGETREPVYVSTLGTWLVRVPFSWLLGVWLGFGLVGVWYSTVFDWAIRALLLVWFFRRGRWRDRLV